MSKSIFHIFSISRVFFSLKPSLSIIQNISHKMDTLYYSNHCKFSQQVLQFLVKGNLANKLNFICIDKRVRDPQSGQITVVLENGQRVAIPPNIQRVPALLLAKQNYRVILGEDIIKHFHPAIENEMKKTPNYQGEPMGVGGSLIGSGGGANIVSEAYSYYNASPDELSAKGTGSKRQMFSYVSADHGTLSIYTPPENYQPDKIGSGVTLDNLQQKRMDEIQPATKTIPGINAPYVPKL